MLILKYRNLKSPQKKQRKNISVFSAFSVGYEHLGGAVAQLGARLNGIQKVRGSNPLSSTNKIKGFRH